LAGIAIIGLSLNLRPVMAAIGPLLDQIEASTGFSHTGASLLTTLPVAVMGLCALFGRKLRQWFGEGPGVAVGAALLVLACLGRLAWPSKAGLIGTAVLAGIGIAFVQTLLPGFIKRDYGAKAGRVMGLYTTGIMGGAAIAAASAPGLADLVGWAGALAIWTVPAFAGLILWFAATPMRMTIPRRITPERRARQFWRNRRAWALLLFFGIGTGAYTLVLAWLPPFYTALGWSRADAAYLLGGLTLTEVLAGLAVSAFVGRFPDRRGPLLFVLVLLLAGLVCLIVAPLSLPLLASGLLGLGIGALFPLSLILTLDHLDDPVAAGDLAAFVQGGGYIIASLMPLLAGILRDRFSDLSQAWMVMATGTVLLALLCLRFSPASYPHLSR